MYIFKVLVKFYSGSVAIFAPVQILLKCHLNKVHMLFSSYNFWEKTKSKEVLFALCFFKILHFIKPLSALYLIVIKLFLQHSPHL